MIRASEMKLAQSAAEPVDDAEIIKICSVADLKREVRRTDDAENAKFEDAIKEAYYRLDGPSGWLNRAILEQKWVGVVDRFDDKIEIPLDHDGNGKKGGSKPRGRAKKAADPNLANLRADYTALTGKKG